MALNPGQKRASSTAAAASLVAVAYPCRALRIRVYNDKASAQYIQVHDAASLPADATVPIISENIATKGITDILLSLPDPLFGTVFNNGIVVCNSSTLATKTIGSADCWFEVFYL